MGRLRASLRGNDLAADRCEIALRRRRGNAVLASICGECSPNYAPGGVSLIDDLFGDILDILSSCAFRLCLKAGHRWEPRNSPPSRARCDWEHSIPGVEGLLSITFRNVLHRDA